MGWISKRFSQNRSKWGKTISEEKRRAPLRRIVHVIRARESLFDSDWVELECGHQVHAFGDIRARCVKCLRQP
jgi:hypothetical protein